MSLLLASVFLELTYLPVPSDVAVFLLVFIQTKLIKSVHQGMGVIVNAVTRDTEIYFAVITTSHLLIIIMFTSARVGFFAPIRV